MTALVQLEVAPELAAIADALAPLLNASPLSSIVEGGVFTRHRVLTFALARGLNELQQEGARWATPTLPTAAPSVAARPAPPAQDHTSRPAHETGDAQIDFWVAFGQVFEMRGAPFRAPQITKRYSWYNWSFGSSDALLCVNVGARSGKPTVWLNLQGEFAEAAFQRVHRRKLEVEHDLGYALDWQHPSHKKEKKILVEYPTEIDYRDRANWPAIHTWMLGRMLDYKRVLPKYLNA